MPAEPEASAGRSGAGTKSAARPAKLSREIIVNAALTFLDREGWDALTINALATQLGTKGPSLYNHVDSLEDLRRTVRMRVIGDIVTMLARVAEQCWRRFGAEYALAGMDVLLHRIGWSVQVPARRAAERDEDAIAAWREETWPVIKGRRRTWAPGSASKTSPARA